MNKLQLLYDLVKSLTGSEKRFFKLTSQFHEGNKNYLKLFDALEKEPLFEEQRVLRTLQGERFVHHLPYENNYLYTMLLRSLRTYHSNFSTDSRIKDTLRNIEILHSKGLFGQAKKRLLALKELSHKEERYGTLLEVLSWERRLMNRTLNSKNYLRDITKIQEEGRSALEVYKVKLELEYLSDLIFNFLNMHSVARNKKQRELVLSVKRSVEGLSVASLRSAHLLIAYNYIHAMAHVALDELQKAYPYWKKILEVMETGIGRKDELYMYNYITVLGNLASFCFSADRLEDVRLAVQKLRSLSLQKGGPNPNIDARLFATTAVLELRLALREGIPGQFPRELAGYLQKHLKAFEKTLSHNDHIKIHYYSACLYFEMSDYKKTIAHLGKIINYKGEKPAAMILYARLLNMIAHLELGNEELVVSQARSVYRFLAAYDNLNKFETIVLSFIQSIMTTERKLLQKEFSEVRKKLGRLQGDPYERRVFEHFNILSWVDKKLLPDTV